MSFTVFDKFGEVGEQLPGADRKELYYALMEYGLHGRTVELQGYLAAIFTALKDDIDNSKSARERGSLGGRPRKKPEVYETKKPKVSTATKPEVSAKRKPNTVQANTVQDTIPKGMGGAHPRDAKEVQAYGDEYRASKDISTPFDGERFCDYFAAQGWQLSNGRPMKDWKAAVRNWVNRDAERSSGAKAVVFDF